MVGWIGSSWRSTRKESIRTCTESKNTECRGKENKGAVTYNGTSTEAGGVEDVEAEDGFYLGRRLLDPNI